MRWMLVGSDGSMSISAKGSGSEGAWKRLRRGLVEANAHRELDGQGEGARGRGRDGPRPGRDEDGLPVDDLRRLMGLTREVGGEHALRLELGRAFERDAFDVSERAFKTIGMACPTHEARGQISRRMRGARSTRGARRRRGGCRGSRSREGRQSAGGEESGHADRAQDGVYVLHGLTSPFAARRSRAARPPCRSSRRDVRRRAASSGECARVPRREPPGRGARLAGFGARVATRLVRRCPLPSRPVLRRALPCGLPSRATSTQSPRTCRRIRPSCPARPCSRLPGSSLLPLPSPVLAIGFATSAFLLRRVLRLRLVVSASSRARRAFASRSRGCSGRRRPSARARARRRRRRWPPSTARSSGPARPRASSPPSRYRASPMVVEHLLLQLGIRRRQRLARTRPRPRRSARRGRRRRRHRTRGARPSGARACSASYCARRVVELARRVGASRRPARSLRAAREQERRQRRRPPSRPTRRDPARRRATPVVRARDRGLHPRSASSTMPKIESASGTANHSA